MGRCLQLCILGGLHGALFGGKRGVVSPPVAAAVVAVGAAPTVLVNGSAHGVPAPEVLLV